MTDYRNNMNGPSGMGITHASPQEEFEAYDSLPATLRHALANSTLKISAIPIARELKLARQALFFESIYDEVIEMLLELIEECEEEDKKLLYESYGEELSEKEVISNE